MVASWRPDLAFQTAFNSDPNDPGAVPLWSDLSTMWTAGTGLKRGRQYELNQNLGSQPTFTYVDPNEYLNPANTSSPYYPGVTTYRQTLLQAMWPNGGTGNLLNTGAQAPGPYDPSFESYAVGSTPSWISYTPGYGGPATVTTTTPYQGAKCLTWGTAGAVNTITGVRLSVPCIPGRQYTTSVYLQQSAANTQTIGIVDQTVGLDRFQRTTANGFGTPDVGAAWVCSGGAASDYATTAGTDLPGGTATVTHTAVNVLHTCLTDTGSTDATVRALTSINVDQAAGSPIKAWVVARAADASNYYSAAVAYNTAGTLTLTIEKRVAGVGSTLGTAALSGGYAAGTQWAIALQVRGENVNAKAWPVSATEPSWILQVADTSLTAGTSAGVLSRLEGGNTNTLPVAVAFQSCSVVGTVFGSSITTAGTWQRQSVTFTATQPLHTVEIATSWLSSSLASTLLMDAIQHEPGGSASAFTTAGPVIYGVWRGSTERWPAEWATDTQGFLGVPATVGVDAYAALNKITLGTEIRNAITYGTPTLYWTLGETGSTVTTWGEVSGNHGPSLTILNSKLGAGTLTSGAATNLAGDPGGVGVTCNTGTTTTNIPGSVLQVGATSATNLGFTVYPPSSGVSTGYTIGFAMTHTTLLSTGGTVPQYVLAMGNLADGATPIIRIYGVDGAPNKLRFVMSSLAGGVLTTDLTDTWADGKPHVYVVTVSITTTTMSTTIYVDGVLAINDGPHAATTLTAPVTLNMIQVGGYVVPQTLVANAAIPGGVYGHVAVWNRATGLPDMGTAGTGYPGEHSGTRIARYLTYGWTGLTSIDTGASIMGVSNLSAGTSLLQACQNVATTENGNFWVDSRGYVTFAARTRNYLNVTSMWTFGENIAGGEYPYQASIRFGFDPTLLYDQVQVNNSGGPNILAVNPVSVRRYYPNTLTRNTNLQNPYEVTDAATYFLNLYGRPRQRVDAIILDPIAYPALWPVIHAIEVGTRITVIRRPKAANGGAGLTMSQDYFVISIAHDNINMDPAAERWLTTLQLQPTDLYQVGILDNATYGLLDSTMILAY